MAKGLYVNPNTFKSISKLQEEIAVRTIQSGDIVRFFNYLPDPDPVLRKLGKSVSVYKELLSDDQVGSTLTRRKMGVKALEWQIIEAEGVTEKEFDLVKTTLKNLERNKIRIKDIIAQSLNPIFFGYSVFEVVWQSSGSYWLPRLLQEKPREWFHFNDKNELILKRPEDKTGQRITGDNADPSFKYRFILLQNEPTYENPYGEKALSRCFWPVTFKRGGLKFWAVFAEKYGMPYLFGKLPRGSEQTAHDDLLGKLELMVQDGIATIPDDSSVDKMEIASGNDGTLYEKFINHCNNSISKAILTNTLSTENQGTGSYAATESHRGTELVLAKEDKDFTAELFNELFRMIIDINIGSGNYPEFDIYEEDDVNKNAADRDKVLFDTGVKFTKKHFIKTYKFEEDDFELKEQDKPNPEFSEKEYGKTLNKLSDDVYSIPDLLPDKLLQMQIEQTLKPVLDLIKLNSSFEIVMSELASLYPMLNTNQLENLLQKVIFVSELEGLTNA